MAREFPTERKKNNEGKKTSPPQSHLGRTRRHLSRQRIHSPASCATTHTTILLLFWNMSGTTRVSRYQKDKTRKVKTNLDLLEQEIVSGSGICWAICKSSTSSQTTTPTSHHSVFLQAGCPSCRPTNSVKALKAASCATIAAQFPLQTSPITQPRGYATSTPQRYMRATVYVTLRCPIPKKTKEICLSHNWRFLPPKFPVEQWKNENCL